MKFSYSDQVIYALAVILCVPTSIVLLSYLDVNIFLLLALLIIIPTGCWFYALSRKKETKGVWPKYFFYGIWGITVTIVLNTYILIGKPYNVTATIKSCDSWLVRDKHGSISDHFLTYTFTNNEFANSFLLRKYSSKLGAYCEQGKMRLTFRNGIFGTPVLKKTEWLDMNDSLIAWRDNE